MVWDYPINDSLLINTLTWLLIVIGWATVAAFAVLAGMIIGRVAYLVSVHVHWFGLPAA